jgi:sporulation-control protein spo0M
MFVHNSTKIKKHNLTYLNVESTPNVQSLLKSIEHHEFPLHNTPVESSFIA